MSLRDNRPASLHLPTQSTQSTHGHDEQPAAISSTAPPSHIRIFPAGSVMATFYTETCNLEHVVPPTPVVSDDTHVEEATSDDEASDMSSGEAPPRGSITELCSVVVRTVLGALRGGHLVGNATKQFGIVWSSGAVTQLMTALELNDDAGMVEGNVVDPAAAFATVIRDALASLGSDLLEGEGLWIRCEDNEGFRLRVAVQLSAPGDEPIVVVIPHAATTIINNTSLVSPFQFLPSQNVLWNAFCVPPSVDRALHIASIIDQWAPWTVDVIAYWKPAAAADGDGSPSRQPTSQSLPQHSPNSSGLHRSGSSALLMATPSTAGHGSIFASAASPPGSPNMSRVPSRVFSVDGLDEHIGGTPNSSLSRTSQRRRSTAPRHARTALRCESHGSSSVVVLRVEGHYTPQLSSILSPSVMTGATCTRQQRDLTVENAQRLCTLYHKVYQAVNAAVYECGGSISAISVFLARPSPAEEGESHVGGGALVTLCVEAYCVIPRIDLTRQMTHFSSQCEDVAVSLVDGAAAVVSDWLRDCAVTQSTMHVGGCLLHGTLHHTPCSTGSTLAHRAAVDLVGGLVLERARLLLTIAQDADRTAGQCPQPLRAPDGVTISCITEISTGNRDNAPTDASAHHGHPSYRRLTSCLVQLVDGAPQAQGQQHRILAMNMLQLKLRTSGLRVLVGAGAAWRAIGRVIKELLATPRFDESTANPHPTLHACLVWGPAKCGKSSLLLDALLHLSVLPVTLFIDGSCCKGSTTAERRWRHEGCSATSTVSLAACPLLMMIFLEGVDACKAAGHTTMQPDRTPTTVGELVAATKVLFAFIASQRQVLVVIIDDMHKVAHDAGSTSLVASLAQDVSLRVSIIASSLEPATADVFRHHGVSASTVRLDDNPLRGGGDETGASPPGRGVQGDDVGLMNVYKVLRQFVSAAVLGEVLDAPSSALSLRRLLGCIRRASCGSLIAFASLGHELKERTELIALTSYVHPTSGVVPLVAAEEDALLEARLEDRLVADASNTFHHALIEHITVLQPKESAWLAAVVCYSAAMGEWADGISVDVARVLFHIVVTSSSGEEEPATTEASTGSKSNSFILEAETLDVDDFEETILSRLSADDDSTTITTAVGLRSLVSLSQATGDKGAFVQLRRFCIPRVVIRLMRSDVIQNACRKLATVEWLCLSLPVHARCWLACMNGSIPEYDAGLGALVSDALDAGGASSTHICHTMRRHGYRHEANVLSTSSDRPSLQAPHGFGRGSEQVPEFVTIALRSDRFGSLSAAIAASEGNRTRLRRSGKSAGLGMVTIVTHFHDIDVAMEHLRFAWRAVDNAALKHAQRNHHRPHATTSDNAHMGGATTSFVTPLSVAGGVLSHWGVTESASPAAEGGIEAAEEAAALAICNEVAESKARLAAVWSLCKRLAAFLENHPLALEAFDAQLRSVVLEADRVVLQAVDHDSMATNIDDPAWALGRWQSSFQALCEALAARCKDLRARASTAYSNIDLRRVRAKIDANVKCTVMHAAFCDTLTIIKDLNQQRQTLEASDISRAAREQQLEFAAAQKVHAARNSLSRAILLVFSCSRATSTTTATRHVDPAAHERRATMQNAPTAVDRVQDRFMIEVTQRYLRSICSLADHVHSSRAALAEDFLDLMISFVTFFATETVSMCVTQRVIDAVGDIQRQNLEKCCVASSPDAWSLDFAVVALEAQAAPASVPLVTSAGKWRPGKPKS